MCVPSLKTESLIKQTQISVVVAFDNWIVDFCTWLVTNGGYIESNLYSSGMW